MIGPLAMPRRPRPVNLGVGRHVHRRSETRLEESDAMRLMGTTKTATAVLDGLEERRRENDGWLVPLSRPLHEYVGARLEDEPPPGTTIRQPNQLMRDLQADFVRLFEAGATVA